MMAIKNGGNLNLYVNGAVVGTPVTTSANVSVNDIGLGYTGSTGALDVTVAGAAIYDKALTASDALAHAQAAGLA